MAIDINTLTWTVTRGASESQIVRKASGSWIVGDVITLTVRDGVSGPIVLQKTVTSFDASGAAVISLGYNDTARLTLGDYVYDIQYSNAAGTVTTLIPPTPEDLPAFVVTEEPADPEIGQVTVGLNYERLDAAPAFDGFSRVVLIVNDEGDAYVSGDTTGRTLTSLGHPGKGGRDPPADPGLQVPTLRGHPGPAGAGCGAGRRSAHRGDLFGPLPEGDHL